MTSLTQIVRQIVAPTAQSGLHVEVGADWAQGRTLFGGLIAALGNAAMRGLVPERPLRALHTVYIGPNSPGTVYFEPTIARAGKAVTLASCTVKSGGELSATVSAVYGAARESMLDIEPRPVDGVAPPEQFTDVPVRAGLPTFTQHYCQRWARGAWPFSRATASDMSVYVRYRNEDTDMLTEAHALALMDAIPSPALALMHTPSPASTLTWTLDILDPRFDFGANEWWRLDAWVDAADGGYVVHSSHVVNPAGRVAAISRQVVAVYG